jgi:hypothetical protein
MKDKLLECVQCDNSFIFTVAEQQRFADQGFDEPRRCPDCRRKKAKASENNEVRKDRGKKKHGRRNPDQDEPRGKGGPPRGGRSRYMQDDDDDELL